MLKLTGCIVVVFVVVFAACGLVSLVDWIGQPKRIHVNSSNFGEQWPLTVPQGDIYKTDIGYRKNAVIFIAPDGRHYGLNGPALTADYPDIHEITQWEVRYGQRVFKSVSPLIDVGLTGKVQKKPAY